MTSEVLNGAAEGLIAAIFFGGFSVVVLGVLRGIAAVKDSQHQ